jgi:hypothetical protein
MRIINFLKVFKNTWALEDSVFCGYLFWPVEHFRYLQITDGNGWRQQSGQWQRTLSATHENMRKLSGSTRSEILRINKVAQDRNTYLEGYKFQIANNGRVPLEFGIWSLLDYP